MAPGSGSSFGGAHGHKLFVVIKMKKDLIIFLGINLATGLIVNYNYM